MKSGLIIAISLFAVSLSGQAETLSLESCSAIENPFKRLTCYDTLAGRMPADQTEASDTSLSTVDPVVPKAEVMEPETPTVEQTPDAEAIFGIEHKQKPEKDRPDELQRKWTQKKKDVYGKWIVTLENGQVWRQTDSKRFSFGNSEQWVVISRGFSGGFFLGEPESHTRIRVKRIK